ncbi:hypothetical protein [Candidatus Pyrohabitans sp.]
MQSGNFSVLKIRATIAGFAGGVALLLLYFGILALAQSFEHALDSFAGLWYWILALSAGFGVQMGLYHYIRAVSKLRKTRAGAGVAASGGMSGAAMVACCAHHVSDVLPLLGISAAALFLTEYQLLFMVLGLLSSIVGTTFMLKIIAQNGFYQEGSSLRVLSEVNMELVFRAILAAAVLVFILVAIAGYLDAVDLSPY